jgi:phosphate transport system substrate-binding protein
MKKLYLFYCIIVLVLFSCNQANNKKSKDDTPTQGTINISVDESFKPVIEEELKVYHVSYPETNIIASYKPEAECFKDLQSDSTRMIIVAKGLTKDEENYFKNLLSFRPLYDIVAYDAVAVIVNAHAKDSFFTIKELRDILSGKKNMTAIMDGNNATSTVRYLRDSVLLGKPLGKNVVGVNGSQAVIDAISKTNDAIGFVGLSWVGDEYDKKQKEQLKKIHLAQIECVTCEEKDMYAKPSQATITYAQYPLARPLYFILKENGLGLGTGFTQFLSLERGQLVFRRSFLVPAKMNFKIRTSKISN